MLVAVASARLVLRAMVVAVASADPAIDPPPVMIDRPGLLKKAASSGRARNRLEPSPRPRAVATAPAGAGAGSTTRLLAWAMGEKVSWRPPPR
jgi:hypothetical protein